MTLFSKGLSSLSPRKRALLELMQRESARQISDVTVARSISPRSAFSPSPQSAAQRRLWIHQQLLPGSSLYTICTALHLTTAVDKMVLGDALNEIVRRHEALRTTFAMQDGQPIQVISPNQRIDLPVIELERLPSGQRPSALKWHINEEAGRPFDLTTGPLFRASLLCFDRQDHYLLLTVHHIVVDGWSLGVLFGELTAIYSAFIANRSSPLPELPIQYADYAVWQQHWLEGREARDQANYWRGQLTDLPPLSLPTDYPRPVSPSLSGARQFLSLSQELTSGLEDIAQREGATLFMTLLAAFQVLLHRLSGQDDFAVGAPIANRTRPETENLIGFFLNTLVLRADLNGDPRFRDLLGRVRETTLAAYARQELPFEYVLEMLRPARDPGRTPLFQVFFNVLNFADERLNRPVLSTEPIDDLAQFDLTFYVGKDQGQLQLQIVYRTDLFESATITRLLDYFQNLLTGIVVNPHRRVSALPFLAKAAWEQLEAERAWEKGHISPGGRYDPVFTEEALEQSLPARFTEQAQKNPQQVAVRAGATEWTYRELDEHSDRVAAKICKKTGTCAGGQSRIALLFNHNAPMIAAILGSLKAGHAYVPLDPAYPRERLNAILSDAKVAAVLSDTPNLTLANEIAAGIPVITIDETASGEKRLLPPVSPGAMAYIIYTSGSTGKPKGVMQNHRNVLHHICAYTNNLHISPTDRLSLLASYGFDAAVMDIYGALLNGATLCLFDIRKEGLAGIACWLNDERISIYHSTPTVYRQVMQAMDTNEKLEEVRFIVLGGERSHLADLNLYRQHCTSKCLFVNGFGPTECTVALQNMLDQQAPITQAMHSSIPLGYPVQETDVLLLNQDDEVVDLFGMGEIVIRSPYVALGYWGRPELTRSRFRPDPMHKNMRLYYTGDLGRRLPDGSIEFVGRMDRQVKIRGHRIECGDVEAALLQHVAIAEALVVAHAYSSDDPALVAYIVLHRDHWKTVEDLRTLIRTLLPDHMVPAAIVPLPHLPLTVNGKVDHRALPVPDLTRELKAEPVLARNRLEAELASLLSDVLGLEHRGEVGILDNFFQLGLHSLKAMQFAARIRSVIHFDVPLRTIFETPTIAGLARVIEQLSQQGGREQANVSLAPWAPMTPVPRENYEIQENPIESPTAPS